MSSKDLNELARTIAGEVLRQLQAKTSAPCVQVLAARSSELEEQVRAQLGDDHDCCFCGEDLAGREPARYVLPHLSCADMAQLAAGGAVGDVMNQVLGLLLRGCRVEVLDFEYAAYGETAPHALYSLYETYAKQLSEFGLVPFKAALPKCCACRDVLITEAVVERYAGVAELNVLKNALVTPLAYDAARNREMTIRKSL